MLLVNIIKASSIGNWNDLFIVYKAAICYAIRPELACDFTHSVYFCYSQHHIKLFLYCTLPQFLIAPDWPSEKLCTPERLVVVTESFDPICTIEFKRAPPDFPRAK